MPWFWMVLLVCASSAMAGPQRTDFLQSELIAEHDAAVPGETVRIGLRLLHDPHWHTYWVNPGDSGLATRINLQLPDGVEAGPIDWPLPQRFDLGDIINFGYAGRALLPITLRVPADYSADQLRIEAEARWLICETECIPGKARYALELPVRRHAASAPDSKDDFAWADRWMPSAADGWSLQASVEDDDVLLHLHGDLPDDIADWQWLPQTARVVAYAQSPRVQRSTDGVSVRWTRNEYFANLPERTEWVLRGPNRSVALQALGGDDAAAIP